MRKIILPVCLFLVPVMVVADDIEVKTAQELYDALDSANDGDVIIIDTSAVGGTINLAGVTGNSLPDLGTGNKSLTIKTNDGSVVTITGDGKSLFAPVSASAGSITFENVNFSSGENADSTNQYGGGGAFEVLDSSTGPKFVFQGANQMLFDGNVANYDNGTSAIQHRGGGVISGGSMEFASLTGDVVFQDNTFNYTGGTLLASSSDFHTGGGATFMTELNFANAGQVVFSNNAFTFDTPNNTGNPRLYFGGGAINGGAPNDASTWKEQNFNNSGDVLFEKNRFEILGLKNGSVPFSSGGGPFWRESKPFKTPATFASLKTKSSRTRGTVPSAAGPFPAAFRILRTTGKSRFRTTPSRPFNRPTAAPCFTTTPTTGISETRATSFFKAIPRREPATRPC